MAKIIRTLRLTEDLDNWLVNDSKEVYDSDRKVSSHIENILIKYKETRKK